MRGNSQSNRPLRIAVLAHGQRVAGGLWAGQSLLAAIGRVAPQHEYLVTITAGLGFEEVCAQIPRCETVAFDLRGGLVNRWWLETFVLRKVITPFRPDVLVALANRGLRRPPCPQVLTVWDAHYFYPRRHYGRIPFRFALKWRYNLWHMRRVLRHTRMLWSQTPVANRRLLQAFSFAGPTAIMSNAVSRLTIDGNSDQSMPEALAPYADRMKLFCLTRYYAHKNLESIVTMLRRFPDELADVVVITTVAADQYPTAGRFLRSIKHPDVRGRIVNVGPLPQSALAGYYRHCQAMFLPTLLESFTITYLEAMHFGVPILTSDLDFARHVCGRAALYFDPWDVNSIKNAILRLRGDSSFRRELVARGCERLRTEFKSWDEIAADAIRCVESLCTGPC